MGDKTDICNYSSYSKLYGSANRKEVLRIIKQNVEKNGKLTLSKTDALKHINKK